MNQPVHKPTAARKLPAGVADAAFASLATFAAGLSAVNMFNDVDRGVYAIFFAAFGLGVVLPWNLILIPAEVNAVTFPVPDRMRRARETLLMGAPVAVIGSLATLVAALMTRSLTDSSVVWGLTATAAVTTVLSPLQDHMRRLLHISEMSWQAAIVSGVQLVGVVASLGVMWLAETPVALLPFGSLAIANAMSLSTALILGKLVQQAPLEEPLLARALAREGRWLLAQALIPRLVLFAVAGIIVALAGAEALGYAEAARVVAQPVLVIATGLTAILAPRAMEAAMGRDLSAARHHRRTYLSVIGIGCAVYLAVASTPWALNPMGHIVPAAYVVSGLVALTIVTNLISAATYLDINELLGARMTRPMAVISILTSPLLLAVALSAQATEAFARPLGHLLRESTHVVSYRARLNGFYASAGIAQASGKAVDGEQ